MFDEVENGTPRNAAISLDETSGNSDENRANVADRAVLIANETLC